MELYKVGDVFELISGKSIFYKFGLGLGVGPGPHIAQDGDRGVIQIKEGRSPGGERHIMITWLDGSYTWISSYELNTFFGRL